MGLLAVSKTYTASCDVTFNPSSFTSYGLIGIVNSSKVPKADGA